MTKIIALIDGSPYTQSIVELGAFVGAKTEASLELVHVITQRYLAKGPDNLSGSLALGARSALLDELTRHDEEAGRLAQSRGRVILDAAKAHVETAGFTKVTARLRHEDLVEAVHDLEGEADLIILGKRGEHADFAKMHLGSNLERVARASHKPVLVAARTFTPITRAVIAFDNGASIHKAIAHIKTGKLFPGIALHLVCAAERDSPLARAQDEAAQSLRQAGFAVNTMCANGEPEHVIGDYIKAHDAHLLVMGAYGHSRIRSLIIGSTTTHMIRQCRVPVMLFR